MTISTEKDTLYFSFHIALSPLELAFRESLHALIKNHKCLIVDDHFYESGGHDQVHIYAPGFEAACRVFADPTIQTAIRLFNLSLMKKGPCAFSHYHCMDLADRLLDYKPIEIETPNISRSSSGLGKLIQNFSQKWAKW